MNVKGRVSIMELVEQTLIDIRDVKDISTLLEYFHDHLNWNLGIEFELSCVLF